MISYEERLLPQSFSVIDIIIERVYRIAPTPGDCVVLKMSLRSVVNFHGAQTPTILRKPQMFDKFF